MGKGKRKRTSKIVTPIEPQPAIKKENTIIGVLKDYKEIACIITVLIAISVLSLFFEPSTISITLLFLSIICLGIFILMLLIEYDKNTSKKGEEELSCTDTTENQNV